MQNKTIHQYTTLHYSNLTKLHVLYSWNI